MNNENEAEPNFPTWLDGWRFVELVTIVEAACIVTRRDPAPYRIGNKILPGNTEALATAIEQAILLKRLKPFAVWAVNVEIGERFAVKNDDLDPHLPLDRDRTTIEVNELSAWCDKRHIRHPWEDAIASKRAASTNSSNLPAELRAANEAFRAVSENPSLLSGRSVKAALIRWLAENQPDLSDNARERIATVANWQPSGGAPKTPG